MSTNDLLSLLMRAAPCPVCGRPPMFGAFPLHNDRGRSTLYRRKLVLECPCDSRLYVVDDGPDPIRVIERWNLRAGAFELDDMERTKGDGQ